MLFKDLKPMLRQRNCILAQGSVIYVTHSNGAGRKISYPTTDHLSNHFSDNHIKEILFYVQEIRDSRGKYYHGWPMSWNFTGTNILICWKISTLSPGPFHLRSHMTKGPGDEVGKI